MHFTCWLNFFEQAYPTKICGEAYLQKNQSTKGNTHFTRLHFFVIWAQTRGWSQTNFLELWSVSRHRLAEISDGFSRKDYRNRNREQLVPAVVACANREQKQWTLMGLVAPRGRWRSILFLRFRSASESVFPGFMYQIFRGFIDSRNVFPDAEVLEIWYIYVLGVKYLQMYVSCMSWCMWCVRGGPTGWSLWR